MADIKEKKLLELAKRLAPEANEPLGELLAGGVISKKDFSQLFDYLSHTLYDAAEGDGDSKRMEKRIVKFFLVLSGLDYESEVNDETLRKAVKLIKETLIRDSQKEALSKLFAAELVANWNGLGGEKLEPITGTDGLLERIEEKIDDGPDYSDDGLIGLVTELLGKLAAYYSRRLTEDELDTLLENSEKISTDILEGRKVSDTLLEQTKFGMQRLGIIPNMRRAFTGLLLGDLILRQVGKSLGIKDDVTVTDFIIFVGVKIFDTEGIKKADSEQVRRVRDAIAAVRSL